MAKHTSTTDNTNLEYGQWCTIDGHRYMIIDWTNESVTVFHNGEHFEYENEFVSNISDFMQTPEEREALGYAF